MRQAMMPSADHWKAMIMVATVYHSKEQVKTIRRPNLSAAAQRKQEH